MNVFNGIPVVITNLIVTGEKEKVRVKTHRKRRIDKKYLKRYGYRYVDVPDDNKVLFVDGKLLMTKGAFKKLKSGIIKL